MHSLTENTQGCRQLWSPVLDSCQWLQNPPEEMDRGNLVVLRACALNSQCTRQQTPTVVTQILEFKLSVNLRPGALFHSDPQVRELATSQERCGHQL
jgi:hypothetical protein